MQVDAEDATQVVHVRVVDGDEHANPRPRPLLQLAGERRPHRGEAGGRGHDPQRQVRDWAAARGVDDVEPRLPGEHPCIAGGGPGILLRLKGHRRFGSPRRKPPEGHPRRRLRHLAQRRQGRLLRAVPADQAQLPFIRHPPARRVRKRVLVGGVPPHRGPAAVLPEAPGRRAEEVGRAFVIAHGRAHAADLLGGARSAGEVGVQPGLAGGVGDRPQRVGGVVPGVVHPEGVRVRGQDVDPLALVVDPPAGQAGRVVAVHLHPQRVHAQHQRAGGIGRLARPGEQGGPRVGGFPREGLAVLVALVAQVPGGDGPGVLRAPDDPAAQADLPLHRQQAGDRAEVRQARRGEASAAHVPGHQADGELQPPLAGEPAEAVEAPKHRRVELLAVGQGRAVGDRVAEGLAAAAVEPMDRLEVRPQRKHAQQRDARGRERLWIGRDHVFAPVAQHGLSRGRRPVVRAPPARRRAAASRRLARSRPSRMGCRVRVNAADARGPWASGGETADGPRDRVLGLRGQSALRSSSSRRIP